VSDYGGQLKRLLQDAGCWKAREGKGSHEIWYSPISKKYFTVVANCKVKHTANAALKDAGLPKAF